MKSPAPTFLTAFLPFALLFTGLLYSNKVSGQQANFTYTASPGLCAPTTLTFTNTSTGYALAYDWDLGDGSTSHVASPQNIYAQPGTYRVSLTVHYANGNSQYYKDITIQPSPIVDFSVNTATSCKPFTATFTDHTIDGFVRTWDFGDGTAPLTTNSTTATHAYTKAGQFNVTLSVTNSAACTQTLTKPALINIAVPVINISGTGLSGCAPLNAALAANVTTINNDPVAQYTWAFGDGTTQTTTTNNTAHNYTGVGAYNVMVTATTQQGCSASVTAGSLVRTGTPPANVSFTATPGTACAGSPIRLLATATNADSYSWDFGDGTTQEGPQNDITHGFKANGTIQVQMKAGRNGCYAGSVPVTVQITGPAAKFTFARSCTNRKAFTFTNTSSTTAGVTYEWDFGDGSALEYTRDAMHVYTQNGDYTVRLTVRETAGTCTSSEFQTVSCFQADFSTGISSICRGSRIGYGVLHVPSQQVHHYAWRFGDNTRLDTTAVDIYKTYEQTGTYTDTLIIFYKDPAVYCNDTVVKPQHITIIAPLADFIIGKACVGQPVTFTDASQPWPNIPLTNWRWSLGNGMTASTKVPPTPTYSPAGTVAITLVITDARNCVDSFTQQLTVDPTPTLSMASRQYKICEGNSITLNAQSNGTVLWSPNDHLSCVGCASTIADPVTDTKYFATASNAFACFVTDSVTVKVVPQVQLTVSSDTVLCKGAAAQLKASGAATYSWAPATGLTSAHVANPISTPEQDVTYTVTGTNDAACPGQTQQVSIQVKPLPTVNAGPDQTVTVGTRITLAATGSADVVSWQWTPAENIDCATCPTTLADVRKPGSYSVKGTNADGCSNSDPVDIHLVCDQNVVYIPSAFSPNGDGENDIFYPRGKGINFIKSFRIFNRWGQEVFKRENIAIDDISSGWNGTYKNQPQAADVYIYFIEARCDNNESFSLKGNVTLLR